MADNFLRIAERLAYVPVDVGGGSTCNVFVVGTERECVLIDASSADTADALIAALSGHVAPAAVRAIVVTHGHGDHYGGAAALARWCSAPVWAHPSAAAVMENRRAAFIAPGSASDNLAAANWERFGRVGGDVVPVERLLREGDVVEAGGVALRVLHTPGHEAGEITLHDSALAAVFVGDLVQGGMDAAGNWLGLFSDFSGQRASLARVAALNPNWLLKGHRVPRQGGDVQADLASATRRLDRIERAVADALAARSPQPLAALVRAAFRGVLGADPAALPNYAISSVQACLLELSHQGRARRTADLEWESAG